MLYRTNPPISAIKKHRPIPVSVLLWFFVFLVLAFLDGCNSTNQYLHDYETETYQDANGYQLIIPSAWTFTSESEHTVSFTSPDNILSLKIFAELGGFGFNNTAEIGDQVAEYLSDNIDGLVLETKSAYWNASRQFRQQLSYMDDSCKMIIDNFIYSPLDGVNYYLFFVTSEENHTSAASLFTDIINSLELCLTEDEIYQYMNDKNADS